jgi:hypothetical protein
VDVDYEDTTLLGAGLFGGLSGLASFLGLMLQVALIAGVVFLIVSLFRNRSQQQPALAGASGGSNRPGSLRDTLSNYRRGLGGIGGGAPSAELTIGQPTSMPSSGVRFDGLLQNFLARFCPHQGTWICADHHEGDVLVLERLLQWFAVSVGQHIVHHRTVPRNPEEGGKHNTDCEPAFERCMRDLVWCFPLHRSSHRTRTRWWRRYRSRSSRRHYPAFRMNLSWRAVALAPALFAGNVGTKNAA